MPEHTDDDSIATDRQTDDAKLAIDTDVESFRENIELALPGEPFAIDVAFRAVTLERVDLEREPGETFADWIRSAVDYRLSFVEYLGDYGRSEDVPSSRPDDYTPAHDTPDEQLVAAVSEADHGEWIGVTVEFTAAALKAMARNVRDDRTVPHWIRHAVHVRFSSIDRDLEIKSPVQVDVPREIAERVQLKATYFVVSDSTDDYADALHNILLEFVQPQFEYLVDGESIDPDDE